ncbi:hypothetical protein GOV14_05920 [Candidatus Pacearchaeota archaeon]|nr:hypothetical protein [Candidatus Pacearchaeota archaeon]
MEKTNEVRIDNNPDKINLNKVGGQVGENIRKNPWMISTIVLGVVAVILLFVGYNGNLGTGASVAVDGISSEDAAGKVVEFLNGRVGGGVEYISEKDVGDLYEITVKFQGQEIPVYVTKDGEYFVQGAVPFEEALAQDAAAPPANPSQPPAPADVPKSDKPVIELFVMSHCPYGTQAEKGILPVFELFGDKIDSNIRFVYYAMHPTQGEVEEQLNQYCIQEEQNDKYYDYLTCFLDKGDGEDCLTKTKINTQKLAKCTKAADTEFEVTKSLEDQSNWLSGRFPLFNVHKELNEKYSVGGSPTLVVNGQNTQSGRDSASYQAVICNAFLEPPAECDTQLSSASPSPGFGFSTTNAGVATDATCA